MGKYNYETTANDYLTPPELVERGLMHVPFVRTFTCDVCCSEKNIPALYHYINGEKDGLKEDWMSINWCNPPFDKCKDWVKKAYEEQLKGNSTVMLIPVRTESAYWHDYILNNPYAHIDWLRKGYRFINAQTNKPMGIFKNALALVLFKGASRLGETQQNLN